MKRRSFIQGVLALLGATVAAKALPESKPVRQIRPDMQRRLDEMYPNGITATKSPLTGERWVFDPNCDRDVVYHMRPNEPGGPYRMVGGDGSGRLFYVSRPLDIPRVGYNLTPNGWEQRVT